MPVDNIALRKLLQLLYLPPNKRKSKLRGEIRSQISKEDDPQGGGGGDFHTPFWSDAKLHVARQIDLSKSTAARINDNRTRSRLYPLLEEGFRAWWREETRWRNEQIDYVPDRVKSNLVLTDLGAVIKVENLMTLGVEDAGHMHVYPYFSEEPVLCEEAARIGLWVMNRAFNGAHADLRILDILRSKCFKIIDQKFDGDEEEIVISRYGALLREWEELKAEYP